MLLNGSGESRNPPYRFALTQEGAIFDIING